MDEVHAVFSIPMIAHAVLSRYEADGCKIYHRTAGDLHDPAFWGVTRLTYDGGRPNRCGRCGEERPAPPEVAEAQRALLRSIKEQEGRG